MNNILNKNYEIIKNGNIFDYIDKNTYLVNPVNCVGVMGAGLAKAFKERFPENFSEYKKICDSGKFYPGDVFYYFDQESNTEILNVATKGHWKDNSKPKFIEKAMHNVCKEVYMRQATQVALPALGCGLGGMKWETVLPIILREVGGKSFGYMKNVLFYILEP